LAGRWIALRPTLRYPLSVSLAFTACLFGDGVAVLARLPDGSVVAARQGCMLALAFHPELTDDLRLHSYFLSMVNGDMKR
jgi:glutamine amidotransferase PdxT